MGKAALICWRWSRGKKIKPVLQHFGGVNQILMSKETFEKNIGELISTIDYCLKSKWNLPSLILIYSGIDIMAWLNIPNDRAQNKRADFIEWATRYLLPNSTLKCSADDLYGARCSLVHTYTAESISSQRGNAREIYYAWGNKSGNELQQIMNRVGNQSIAIHIKELFNAFKNGVELFKKISQITVKKLDLYIDALTNFLSILEVSLIKYLQTVF